MSESADKDARMFAMLCHLLGIFVSFLGALIIWLIKREESPFVDDQGKEALNFQITVLIGWVIVWVITAVTCVGGVLAPVLAIANIVFCIIAALKANNGETYRYPVCLRFIK